MAPRIARFFPLEDKVTPLKDAKGFPAPPPWRDFAHIRPWTKPLPPPTGGGVENQLRGGGMVITDDVVDAVNAALILRRPLLVTGKPGIGKSTLAYAVAHRLALGPVLVWPITSRSTLKQGQYEYDAVARLESAGPAGITSGRAPPAGTPAGTAAAPPATNAAAAADPDEDIGRYLRLGPLGTAMLPTDQPRVLLIDEIDKSDVDLPNDLLHVLEEGRFRIDELARLPEEDKFKTVHVLPHDSNVRVPVSRDGVFCREFPVVILTSNAEREFPPAFNRRCIRVTIPEPDDKQLEKIIKSRLFRTNTPDGLDLPKWEANAPEVGKLIGWFLKPPEKAADLGVTHEKAVDQLLNAVHLMLHGYLTADDPLLRDLIFRSLSDTGAKEGA